MCVEVSLARNLIRVPKKICCASRCQSIVFFGDLMNFKNDKADRNRAVDNETWQGAKFGVC